jgi:hypothetical protein
MDTKNSDFLSWVIWIALLVILVVTAVKTDDKIKNTVNLNEANNLPELKVVDNVNEKPIEIKEPIVEIETPLFEIDSTGSIVIPVGTNTEICTPETCPPTVTYSNRGIFSRWRKR